MKTYPIAATEKKQSGVRAVKTGEFRPPKAGEWYLSGAIPEAYRAPNNLSTSFYIVRLKS
jgi:hypothetical protein